MPSDRETQAQELTPLARAIQSRQRPVEVFDVAGVFGLGGEVVPQVALRVMVKRDEDVAIKAARAYVSGLAGSDAVSDPDVMLDAKNVEAMFRACRDPQNPENPIFPGPQWMRDHLTTDQVATLVNAYAEVRRKHGGADWGVDEERVEAIVKACWDARGTELPELALARIPREALTTVIVQLACKLVREREPAAGEPAGDAESGA